MASVEKYVDKAYETKTWKELASAPVAALQGVSEEDGLLLGKAFGVKTVADLATLKYVKWAQAIVAFAEKE